jgi:ABC-type antimicrobial peptide transport system permease subunit
MKKRTQYLKSALYNIRQNKGYTLFCVLSTTLTFIFVTFLVHFGAAIKGDYPPSVNSGRIITLNTFTDTEGKNVGALSATEQKLLLGQLKMYENYAAYNHFDNPTGISMNENYFTTIVKFVNAGFWKLYRFSFIAGRPFTEEESAGRTKCAVITKNLSTSRFHTVNSVGRKIEMDRTEYEIVGVVDNFSILSSPSGAAEIWFPDVFDNSGSLTDLSILFSPQVDMRQAGEEIAGLIRQIYETKHIQVNMKANDLLTDKEKNRKKLNIYGNMAIGLMVFLFLLIPALNIISLNMANTSNKAEEIATRRTFGASRASVFLMLLFDNLLLTLLGVVIGILSAKPFVSLIQNIFFDEIPMLAGASLMPDTDIFLVVAAIIPLMIVFLLMFSGFPAWMMAKRSISDILKGGVK